MINNNLKKLALLLIVAVVLFFGFLVWNIMQVNEPKPIPENPTGNERGEDEIPERNESVAEMEVKSRANFQEEGSQTQESAVNEFSKVIGPDGGEIKIADPKSPLNGVVLKIPAGALSSNQFITISIPEDLSEEEISEAPLPPISLEPNDLTFNVPVTLVVPYSEEKLKSGNSMIFEESLKLYLYDEELDFWLGQESGVDSVNNLVITELSHFSSYILNGN